jgi:F-type H+-transporting ATPase subunit b
MSAIRIGLLAAEASDKENLYPHAAELVVGAVAFAVIFFFMWKWVIPRVNTLLEERRQKIQGELERAEETRSEADHILEEYRTQLAGAREEAGRIIEETRKTAEQLRKDMLARAEEESQGIVARAQDEIRAERDRVFQELRSQIGEISVELAARIVGESLDEAAHQRLIDEYIDQVAGSGTEQG